MDVLFRKRQRGIVTLSDCKLFSACLHEAKPLTLCREAIDNLPGFGWNSVNVTKPAPERIRDGGYYRPGDGREPERPDDIRAQPEEKQRGRCDDSGRKTAQHEGALAPRRLARVSVRMRSRHGRGPSVWGLFRELRSGLRHRARSGAGWGVGTGSAPAGPARATSFTAQLGLLAASLPDRAPVSAGGLLTSR